MILNSTKKHLTNVLTIISSFYLISYLLIAIFHLFYPFECEWMEGGTVDNVRYLITHGNLYVIPSINYIPYAYPPLYSYISSLSCIFFGITLFSLRLVSFLSSIGIFILIFKFVQKETKSKQYAFISMCLFAATYKASGFWFDLARVDSLFLYLFLSSIYMIRFHETRENYMIAGFLLAFAVHTKQTALIMCSPILVYVYSYTKDRLLVSYLANWFIFILAILFSYFYLISHGWYYYYVFILPQQYATEYTMIVNFWTQCIFGVIPIVTIISLIGLFILKRINSDSFKFYGCLLVGGFVGSWFTMLKVGGYLNNMMPLYAILAVLFGISISSIKEYMIEYNPTKANRTINIILVFCIIQFIMLAYNPINQIPTKDNIAASNELVDIIKTTDGNVFIPNHGYISSLANKDTYAQTVAISDIMRSNNETLKNTLLDSINNSMTNGEFKTIILDRAFDDHTLYPEFINYLNTNYVYSNTFSNHVQDNITFSGNFNSLRINDSISFSTRKDYGMFTGGEAYPAYIFRRI
jgi:hypothetical protein